MLLEISTLLCVVFEVRVPVSAVSLIGRVELKVSALFVFEILRTVELAVRILPVIPTSAWMMLAVALK